MGSSDVAIEKGNEYMLSEYWLSMLRGSSTTAAGYV
jgi:hypothetical protein